MSTEKEAPEEEVPEKGIALLHSKGSYWLPHNPEEICGGCDAGRRLIRKYLKEVGVKVFPEKHPNDPTLRRVELPENVRLTISEAHSSARLFVPRDARVVVISRQDGFSLSSVRWHMHTELQRSQLGEESSSTPETALAA